MWVGNNYCKTYQMARINILVFALKKLYVLHKSHKLFKNE